MFKTEDVITSSGSRKDTRCRILYKTETHPQFLCDRRTSCGPNTSVRMKQEKVSKHSVSNVFYASVIKLVSLMY